MGKSLGEALPDEIARVTQLLALYKSIGPGGSFAAAGMTRDLDAATRALAEGDVVAMLQAHEHLKGWTE